MLKFQINGLGQLTSQFEELSDAIGQLNGELCQIGFDPSQPHQVQAAIRTMERAVDERLSDFSENPLAQQFAAAAKEKFKCEISKRVDEARQQLAIGKIPFDPLNRPGLLAGTG